MSGEQPGRSRAELVAEDAEARLLAQTWFGPPLVLEAGAGTGKTTALVARVVAVRSLYDDVIERRHTISHVTMCAPRTLKVYCRSHSSQH